jgi:hypothetical protein
MKTYFASFVIIAIFTMLSCKDQGSQVENPLASHPSAHGEIVSGKISANFVDTISEPEAEKFILGLNLTIVDLSRVETDSLHYGIIGVPIGEEQLWMDSLRTYPAFIKNTSRIAVMYQP